MRLVTDGFGKMRHIRLRNLFVHDVNGDLRKTQEGCGIFFESRGGNQSHFDDLLIENCHVLRADRNGICQRNNGGARSLHVVIRGNPLEDIGGDGIKPWGSNGALVVHNVVRGGRMRCQDAAAGIWPWDCDDTIIQFNEVSGMKGTNDGQGFDSDPYSISEVIPQRRSAPWIWCAPAMGNNFAPCVPVTGQRSSVNVARGWKFRACRCTRIAMRGRKGL